MSVIKWRESYNIGVEQFDAEHRKLVEMIGVMYEVVRDKSDKERVKAVCEEILSYTEYHFANEEQALREINYPYLEEQIAQHAKLKSEAMRLQAVINESYPEGSIEFYHFLRDWLINHILNCDKQYNSYLNTAPKG
jgi:hemerythrin-like metal-binding protein